MEIFIKMHQILALLIVMPDDNTQDTKKPGLEEKESEYIDLTDLSKEKVATNTENPDKNSNENLDDIGSAKQSNIQKHETQPNSNNAANNQKHHIHNDQGKHITQHDNQVQHNHGQQSKIFGANEHKKSDQHKLDLKPHKPNHGHHEPEKHEQYHEKNIFLSLYHNHYKALMIFSILLLAFSVGAIGFKYFSTGEFVSKGITLKGGLTLTINTQQNVNSDMLEKYLRTYFPKSDINVRTFSIGSVDGFVVEASDLTTEDLLPVIRTQVSGITDKDYSSEITGPSLGASFFAQTLKAIFVAFLFMSLVVYLYFGESTKIKWLTALLSITAGLVMFYSNSIIVDIIPFAIMIVLIFIYFRDNIPSFGIMLCAFSDVFFSLAIFNLMGLKLNTAGVAAFLMLVGYSIDTDILLAVRVLKRREGSIFERTIGAMKTGMMMSLSALIAVLSAYFLTHSSVIKEIMFILAVGLVGDVIFTWIQNAGILRWHLENKGWK